MAEHIESLRVSRGIGEMADRLNSFAEAAERAREGSAALSTEFERLDRAPVSGVPSWQGRPLQREEAEWARAHNATPEEIARARVERNPETGTETFKGLPHRRGWLVPMEEDVPNAAVGAAGGTLAAGESEAPLRPRQSTHIAAPPPPLDFGGLSSQEIAERIERTLARRGEIEQGVAGLFQQPRDPSTGRYLEMPDLMERSADYRDATRELEALRAEQAQRQANAPPDPVASYRGGIEAYQARLRMGQDYAGVGYQAGAARFAAGRERERSAASLNETPTIWAVGEQEWEGPPPGSGMPPPERGPGGTHTPTTTQERRRLTDEEIDADRRKAISASASDLTDQQLIRTIKDRSAALEELHRRVAEAGKEQEKLTEADKAGKDVTVELTEATEKHRWAQQERRDMAQELSIYEKERRDRGIAMPMGGAGFQQIAGGFLGGMGLGGGSPIGLGLGALMGVVNPWTAAATLAGMGVGYATSLSGQAVDEQRSTYETGMMLGSFDDLRGGAERRRGPWLVPYQESMAATRALATATGRTDIEGITAFSRAYGLNLPEQAGLMGQFGRLGRLPVATGEIRAAPADITAPPPPSAAYLAAAVLGGGTLTPDRVEEVTRQPTMIDDRRGDLSGLLAGAFERSRYAGVGGEGRHALIRSFKEQALRLAQVQGAGGAPILDADMGFGGELLSRASQLYPEGTTPEIAAAPAAGMMQTMQRPASTTARGLELRAIMQLATSDPELRDRILKAKGWDIGDYTGARAAMENMFSLGPDGGAIQQATLGAVRGAVGTDTSMSHLYWAHGRPAAIGLKMEELSGRLAGMRPGAPARATTMAEFQALYQTEAGAAGTERQPAAMDISTEQLAATGGKEVKLLGQSIRQSVQDFIADIIGARTEWEKSVAPAPGVHHGAHTP